jgi:hypothetical protein
MSRPASRDTGKIILGYSTAARTVRDRVVGFVDRTWRALPAYRDPDIDHFVTRAVPIVTGAQRTLAAMTAAYLAALEAETLNVDVAPRGVPAAVLAPAKIRGVAPATVYRRPAITVYRALAAGKTLSEAVDLGAARASTLVSTDLQLARTHATRYLLERNDNVAKYRRVPGGDNVCDLCELAAEQDYSTDDLMPIHPNCSCDVEPIFDGAGGDPGIADLIDSTDDTDRLGDNGIAVHEHGELGPVLAVAGQHFTGPGGLSLADDFGDLEF